VTAPPAYSPSTFARTHPERPAVITSSGHTVTFAEMEARSCQLAQALYAYGLRPGDHVAVVALNDHHTLDIAWALMRSGLHLTFVNTHLAADEAAYVANDCGARVLIVSAALDPLPAELAALTPDFELRLAVGGPVPDGYQSYDDFVAGHPTTPLDEELEGALMLYSSGTTGRPKGILRALSGQPFGSDGVLVPMLRGIMGFNEGDVYLNPAPLYHASPLAWSMTAQRLGGTVVVMERFDPDECLRLIEEHHVSHAQFVPTMFVRLLKLPDEVRKAHDVSSLRAVLHAAAPCPPEVKRRMIEWWGPIIEEFYAGTEGGGMTWINSQQALAHPGSVGPAIWGEIHVCDDEGKDLPSGEDGVIWFGGTPNAFEYHNDPVKTKETINERGWTTLWDVGHLDDEGYLYLTDRKTFMIVSGGVNIYPQEVENILVMHPAVADVAVIGVPDPDMGEQVKAVVQPAAGVTPDETLAEELLAYCRDNLSRYKCPRTLDFTDALPRGENGKLYKKQLRATYWSEPSSPSSGR
jgi:acyl-CoA synthetase (AMP-forming)/AMP-acid ligase II